MFVVRSLPKLRFCQRHIIRRCSVEVLRKESYIEKLRKGIEQDENSRLVVPVFKKALLFPDQIAIKDNTGEYTYFQLYMSAKKLSFQISNICGGASQSNVVFLCSNNVMWIIVQWACWLSGQVAVPLDPTTAQEQLKMCIDSCRPKLIISDFECENVATSISKNLDNAFLAVESSFVPTMESLSALYSRQIITTYGSILTESTLSNHFYTNANAMLLYTAGSINTPKAAVLTYRNIEAQMKCVELTWKLSCEDTMLHLIPMLRIQTAVNSLLNVGGSVLLHQQFDSHNIWSAILGINNPSKQRINIFLAVPTIYTRLIAEYDKLFAKDLQMVEYIANHCKNKFRLMASTIAPLPESVFYRWRDITGRNLVEYYGMVETGLVLGNLIDDICCNDMEYRPGMVGFPLPGVKARLVNKENKKLINMNRIEDITECTDKAQQVKTICPNFNASTVLESITGELEIAGDVISSKYYKQAEEGHAEESVDDGYFKTNDIFSYNNTGFKFLGKLNDIITVGDYKVYSSDVRKVLFTYPGIKDVAVLGIPNKIWGQCIGVVCILGNESDFDLKSIKDFCYVHLPTHKRPTVFKTIAK